jgi:uncharacterized protein YndB with AHSA1/START domain
MTTSDLKTIEKHVFLRAPRERVWRAITTPEEFGAWFGVKITGSFEPGARVPMVATIEPCKDENFYVIIDRIEPQRLFSWRWHPGMPRPEVNYETEPMTTVTFELEDAEGGTNLKVTETGFDAISITRRAAVYEENVQGWNYQAESLGRYVGQA